MHLPGWCKQEQEAAMDFVIELGKAALAFGVLFAILIAIPILFIFIFEIATGLDDRLSR
jgi:Sec-independent protein secretion pathway component TatC